MPTLSERDRNGIFAIAVEDDASKKLLQLQARSADQTMTLVLDDRNETLFKAWRAKFATTSVQSSAQWLSKQDAAAFLETFHLPTDAGLSVAIERSESGQCTIKINAVGSSFKVDSANAKAFLSEVAAQSALVPPATANLVQQRYPRTQPVAAAPELSPAPAAAQPATAEATPAPAATPAPTAPADPGKAPTHTFESGNTTLTSRLNLNPTNNNISFVIESKSLLMGTWLEKFGDGTQARSVNNGIETGKEVSFRSRENPGLAKALGLPPGDDYLIKIASTQQDSRFGDGIQSYRETLIITDSTGKLVEADRERMLARMAEMDSNGLKPLPQGIGQQMVQTLPTLESYSPENNTVRIAATSVQRPNPHGIELVYDEGTYLLKIHAPKANDRLDSIISTTKEIQDHLKSQGIGAYSSLAGLSEEARAGTRIGYKTTSEVAHSREIGCIEIGSKTSAQQILNALSQGPDPFITPETAKNALATVETAMPKSAPIRNQMMNPTQQQQHRHMPTGDQIRAQQSPAAAQPASPPNAVLYRGEVYVAQGGTSHGDYWPRRVELPHLVSAVQDTPHSLQSLGLSLGNAEKRADIAELLLADRVNRLPYDDKPPQGWARSVQLQRVNIPAGMNPQEVVDLLNNIDGQNNGYRNPEKAAALAGQLQQQRTSFAASRAQDIRTKAGVSPYAAVAEQLMMNADAMPSDKVKVQQHGTSFTVEVFDPATISFKAFTAEVTPHPQLPDQVSVRVSSQHVWTEGMKTAAENLFNGTAEPAFIKQAVKSFSPHDKQRSILPLDGAQLSTLAENLRKARMDSAVATAQAWKAMQQIERNADGGIQKSTAMADMIANRHLTPPVMGNGVAGPANEGDFKAWLDQLDNDAESKALHAIHEQRKLTLIDTFQQQGILPAEARFTDMPYATTIQQLRAEGERQVQFNVARAAVEATVQPPANDSLQELLRYQDALDKAARAHLTDQEFAKNRAILETQIPALANMSDAELRQALQTLTDQGMPVTPDALAKVIDGQQAFKQIMQEPVRFTPEPVPAIAPETLATLHAIPELAAWSNDDLARLADKIGDPIDVPRLSTALAQHAPKPAAEFEDLLKQEIVSRDTMAARIAASYEAAPPTPQMRHPVAREPQHGSFNQSWLQQQQAAQAAFYQQRFGQQQPPEQQHQQQRPIEQQRQAQQQQQQLRAPMPNGDELRIAKNQLADSLAQTPALDTAPQPVTPQPIAAAVEAAAAPAAAAAEVPHMPIIEPHSSLQLRGARGVGAGFNIVMGGVGLISSTKAHSFGEKMEAAVNTGSGVAGVVEGAAMLRNMGALQATAGRLGIVGAIAAGGIGTIDGLVHQDGQKVAKSIGNTAAAFVGFKAGAALGATLGPIGGIIGGLAGGAAGYMGMDALIDAACRPTQLDPKQQAFFNFIDAIPDQIEPGMSPDLQAMVKAKAELAQANAALKEATSGSMLPQQAQAVRAALEQAEQAFVTTYDGMRKEGRLVQVAGELGERNERLVAATSYLRVAPAPVKPFADIDAFIKALPGQPNDHLSPELQAFVIAKNTVEQAQARFESATGTPQLPATRHALEQAETAFNTLYDTMKKEGRLEATETELKAYNDRLSNALSSAQGLAKPDIRHTTELNVDAYKPQEQKRDIKVGLF